jgi:hypothetical protein
MGLLIAGVTFLCLGASCGTIMTFLVFHEIAVVNRKHEMQIPYFGEYGFQKMDHIKEAYKELYPNGRVESWRLRLKFAMVSFLALAAITSVIGALITKTHY